MILAQVRRRARSVAFLAIISTAFFLCGALVSSQAAPPQSSNSGQQPQHRRSTLHSQNFHTEQREHRKESLRPLQQSRRLEADELGSPRSAALRYTTSETRRAGIAHPQEEQEQEEQQQEQQGQQQTRIRNLDGNNKQRAAAEDAEPVTATPAPEEIPEEEPTSAPEASTPEPVTATPAPEEIPAAEDEPTAAPASTPEPVPATPAPEDIPVAEEEPTATPEASTPEPVTATPAPEEIAEEEPTPTPEASTPEPVPATPAPEEMPAAEEEPTPSPEASTPEPVTATPAPEETAEEDPTAAPEASTPAPVTATPAPEASTPAPVPAVEPVDAGGDCKKVATPRFTGKSTHSIMSYTAHIECDTEGATIRYTLDGSDPITTTTTSVHDVPPGEPILVHKIGTVTIRAVATKEGMEDSDEAQKTVTIQDQVQDPELFFVGEKDESGGDDENANSFLRTVAISMNCSTPNVTLRYTTDGVSVPGDASPSVPAGTVVQWSEEGTTEFRVIAVADGLYHSELTKWPVTVVAPRTDEYSMAGSGSASSSSSEGSGASSDGDGGSSDGGDMPARVEVTAFKAVYAAPASELEQEEGVVGPGYGAECEGGARVVSGKLVRLFNPSRHFSFAAPPGACDAGGGAQVLSPASDTSRAFETVRRTAPLLDGESPEEARVRLDLDAREAAWRAAGGGVGCQATVAGGLLPPEGANTGDGGGSCAVGHLVGGGQVFNAEEGTGLVSFGVRGDYFVVGDVTAEEVLDQQNPFQNLISGAGWLVRAGVNHVDASARDGHLDILLNAHDDDVNGSDAATVDDDGTAAGGDGGGLEDVLVAKLARTAIGHDAEGRLILLQTSGAPAGSDQDTAIPDGLDLSELADVLVEAGAVNAINLIGGAPSALVVNGSAVADPAEACWSDGDHGTTTHGGGDGGGFSDGSTLPRCERPVSSVVCVHLDPPPMIEGSDGGDSDTPASGAQSSSSSSSSAATAASSSGEGDDWNSGWDSSGSDDKDDVRLQWEHDLCGGNSTGNATSLWEHLDDVEESVLRYKIAFWVAAVLGLLSLYFNIQHQKSSSASASRSAELGGGVYGGQLQQQQQHVGLINGGVTNTGTTTPVGGAVEMISKGSKRGSRSSRRKRGSSNGGGGYARVNGDADWDDDGAGGGGGGPHGLMDSEEDVDLGLVPSRSSSSRKREKGKSGRLRKALSKVSKGRGGGATGHGGGDLDAAMAINPFGGGGGGRRGSGGGPGEAYDVV